MPRSTTERPIPGQRGLTLLELIVTMVILGIIAAAASFFFANGMQGYQLNRSAADLALKSQIALERLSLELRDMNGLSGGSQVAVVPDVSIQYASDSLPSPRAIGYDATSKTLYLSRTPGVGEHTLLDQVTAFTLSVDTSQDLDGQGSPNEISAVNITFTSGGKTFSLRVLPRHFLYP